MKCPARENDDVGWVCYMPEGHEGDHRPALSEEAKQFVLDADDLNEALFDLANLFNVPLTNNGVTWFQSDGNPVYDVNEFIELMRTVIEKFKVEEG